VPCTGTVLDPRAFSAASPKL